MAPRLKCVPAGLTAIDTRIARPAPKRSDPFYQTPAWRKLMSVLIESRGAVCQQCGRTGTRLFGDHVQELKDGGATLDPANVKLVCGSCHTKKTIKARAARTAQRHTR